MPVTWTLLSGLLALDFHWGVHVMGGLRGCCMPRLCRKQKPASRTTRAYKNWVSGLGFRAQVIRGGVSGSGLLVSRVDHSHALMLKCGRSQRSSSFPFPLSLLSGV